jgi:RNA polymerase sigma factor (sigma-70 family)
MISSAEPAATARGFAAPEAQPAATHGHRTEGETAGSLVVRARNGERGAWDDLVSRFTPLLWAIARAHRLSRDDAADAVQVTWLRCVEHLDRLRDPSRLAGWLVTTCRRECLTILKLAARQVPRDVADLREPFLAVPDGDTDPVDVVVARDEVATLNEAVARLPERPRRLITAILAADPRAPGYAMLAEELGMPIGGVGPTRLRALRRLRQELQPDEPGEPAGDHRSRRRAADRRPGPSGGQSRTARHRPTADTARKVRTTVR